MSEFVGADLAQLDALVTALVRSADAFGASSNQIVSDVKTAVEGFKATVTALKTDADSLSADMDNKMGSLDKRAAQVQWTGNTRSVFDEANAGMVANIRSVRSAIEAFSTEAKGIVDGKLATSMEGLSAEVAKYGQQASATASEIARCVKVQKENIDAVLN